MYNYYDYRKVDSLKSGDAKRDSACRSEFYSRFLYFPVGASFTRDFSTDTKGFLFNDPWKSYRDNRRNAER